MNYFNQEPNYLLVMLVAVLLLLFSCNDTPQKPVDNNQPQKGTTVPKTVTTTPSPTPAATPKPTPTPANEEAPAYCERIEYRYFTRDVMPFTSNPCTHPVSPKCYWNQVRFHISGPSNKEFKLTKITIDEGTNLTFGSCKTCPPNGALKTTNDKPDWLTICDGNEQTGVLSIEVKDKATRDVLGVCEKPFSFKVTPPCPAGK